MFWFLLPAVRCPLIADLRLVICLWVFICTSASAALVDNLTVGNAKALSLGHAVTADPPGVDAIHYNPAGLVRLRGETREFKFLAGTFDMGIQFGEQDPQVQAFLNTMIEDLDNPPQFFTDPLINTQSKTKGAALMLPGFGMQELPAIAAPMMGFAWHPKGSRWTFATGVYAPTAAGYTRPEDDPGRYLGQQISLARLTYFSPSFGYRVNDTLAVGGSIGFSYQGVGVDLSMRVPNAALAVAVEAYNLVCNGGDPVVDICQGVVGPYTEVSSLSVRAEEALSLTYNLGVLWEPKPWLALGMVYQSGDGMDLSGSYDIQYDEEWSKLFSNLREDETGAALVGALDSLGMELPYGNAKESGSLSIQLNQPAHFSVGVSMKVLPRWKVNVDAKWTDWASWEVLPLYFDQRVDFLRLARIVQPDLADYEVLKFIMDFKNVWNVALGMEYQFSDRLALRMGYEPRPCSIPENRHTVLLPMGDADLYGLGFSYRFNESSVLEMAFAYLYAESNIEAGESLTSNSLDQLQFIYNPYMGLEYRSEVTASLFEMSYRKSF